MKTKGGEVEKIRRNHALSMVEWKQQTTHQTDVTGAHDQRGREQEDQQKTLIAQTVKTKNFHATFRHESFRRRRTWNRTRQGVFCICMDPAKDPQQRRSILFKAKPSTKLPGHFQIKGVKQIGHVWNGSAGIHTRP